VPHVEKGQRLRHRRHGEFLRVPENGSSCITRRSKREPRRGRRSSNGSKGSITALVCIRRLASCRRSNTNARSELLNCVSVFGGKDHLPTSAGGVVVRRTDSAAGVRYDANYDDMLLVDRSAARRTASITVDDSLLERTQYRFPWTSSAVCRGDSLDGDFAAGTAFACSKRGHRATIGLTRLT
jgi:hypothetical protein